MSSNGGITTKVEHIERSGNVESIERKNVPNVKSSSLVNLTGVRKPKSPRFIIAAKKNGRKRHLDQVHIQSCLVLEQKLDIVHFLFQLF